ncbi:MAG: copper chaperone PCu(A)C [Pseudomonadota bacterium]
MSLNSVMLAAATAFSWTCAAMADGAITIHDAYARSSGPNAKAGAAFMTIINEALLADRLIGVKSDRAARVELHTHEVSGDGVMTMTHVEDGFVIPPQGEHALARGGDHVMFMGLLAPFEHGATFPVTLTFENAGEIEIEILIDQERQDGHGGHKKTGS